MYLSKTLKSLTVHPQPRLHLSAQEAVLVFLDGLDLVRGDAQTHRSPRQSLILLCLQH